MIGPLEQLFFRPAGQVMRLCLLGSWGGYVGLA